MKKIVSLIALATTLTMLLPQAGFAAVVPQDLIQSITLTVNGSAATTFQPASGQVLTTSVDFNIEQFGNELANSSGYVAVKQNSTIVRTLASWTNSNVTAVTVSGWNGSATDDTDAARTICGSTGAVCPNGNYTVEAHVNYTSGTPPDTFLETQTVNLVIGSPSVPLSITTFTVTAPGGTLDPAPSADNEDLTLIYTLNQAPDQVSVVIKDSSNDDVKTFVSSNATETFTWDGVFANKLVLPGNYSATLTATKTGSTNVTNTQNFTVAYNHQDKGEITDFTVTPTSFDPDFEDAVIEFKNTKDTNLTVEIQNASNDEVRGFDDYDSDNYGADSSHSIAWNGKNNIGSDVSLGSYKVVAIARNDFGVTSRETTVAVNNSGGTINTNNAHISGISLSPSSKFEPAEDDDLTIEFDVLVDLDELKIFAVRGNEKIELFNEEEVEEENNLEISWDGTDDNDDYAAQGSWRIQFESKVGATSLTAAKSINVQYKKPQIDDLYISKDKIDNDLNEFTYILFRVDEQASVDIKVLESNDEDDDIVEDMEVEANRWYGVQWDGGSYDYDDDIDIKLIASNRVNEDVFESKKVSVDLAEDEVSSSKSNVTGDYIEPVITDGYNEMTLYYNLEDTADVTVTIHRGQTASGSVVIELLDVTDQASGDHSLTWNGRDDDGDRLSSGLYSYKIVSKTGSTETEKGVFVVGVVGEVEGRSGRGSDDSSDSGSDSDNSGNPNVIVDGVSFGDGDSGKDGFDDGGFDSGDVYCAGFYDVFADDPQCEAISWAKERGIFQGYGDSTFKPFAAINRAEILTVILRTLGISADPAASGNLGFSDVEAGAWYVPYISVAKNLGIFHGDSGKNTARPADSVNRAEATKLLFAGLTAITGNDFSGGCDQPYFDVPQGAWFYDYACRANDYGLFDSALGGNFGPAILSNRGEIATALYRLYLYGWL